MSGHPAITVVGELALTDLGLAQFNGLREIPLVAAHVPMGTAVCGRVR
jgi:hypothetical protein